MKESPSQRNEWTYTEPFQNELPKAEYINNSVERLIDSGWVGTGERRPIEVCAASRVVGDAFLKGGAPQQKGWKLVDEVVSGIAWGGSANNLYSFAKRCQARHSFFQALSKWFWEWTLSVGFRNGWLSFIYSHRSFSLNNSSNFASLSQLAGFCLNLCFGPSSFFPKGDSKGTCVMVW